LADARGQHGKRLIADISWRSGIDTLTCLDLGPKMLRKSAPVYQAENIAAEIGPAKLVAFVVSAAELAIARITPMKGRPGNTSMR
jgi:hypothetical protein